MKRYILLSEKSWHKPLFENLKKRSGEQWYYITDPQEFIFEHLQKLQPDKIFIPHWSFIIPAQIFEIYECIVFHMTDLPFGRGGSPLQNLIVRGFLETKISAIRVEKGLDAGPLYCKAKLDLSGTAHDIFLRSVPIIQNMITLILNDNPQPTAQEGKSEIFKRRTPADGNIAGLNDLSTIYDYIRMLDAETYPPAFLETEDIRIEFFNAQKNDNEINAHVRIIKK